MHLTINMRIQDDEQKQFVDYLLRIGEGKELVHSNIGEDMVKLHNDIIVNNEEVESLIHETFGNIVNNFNNTANYIDYIKDRAILTTKNEDVDEINEQIIKNFLEILMYSYQLTQLKMKVQFIRIFIPWNS